MWFAALGRPEHNVWFINLIAKLLEGSPAVLNLIDTRNHNCNFIRSCYLSFTLLQLCWPLSVVHLSLEIDTASPPKQVRTTLFHYDFTRLVDYSGGHRSRNVTNQWWWRSRQREYLAAMTLDAQLLSQARNHLGVGRHPCNDMTRAIKKARKNNVNNNNNNKNDNNNMKPIWMNEAEKREIAKWMTFIVNYLRGVSHTYHTK
jgi:hypothetical protein